jgi:hypothetical protein
MTAVQEKPSWVRMLKMEKMDPPTKPTWRS